MRIVMGAAVCGAGLLGGCASTSPHGDGPMPLEHAPRTRAVLFDGTTGEKAQWSTLVNAAVSVDAVFIGESHGHPLGLSAASALWDDILDETDSAALALEFFERDQQALIDDYLSDVVTEKQFKELARRSKGNYPDGHRAMVEAAKAAKRPVFAANAPRRYLRIGKEGYEAFDAFTDEQRRLVAAPGEMPGGSYRESFMEMMTGMSASHGGADAPEVSEEEAAAKLESSFRAQCIWDATMSDTAARAAAQGNSPVVLVIGNFHVINHGGTVQLFERAMPDASHIVILVTGKSGDELEEEDLGSADYVLYVGDE